MKFNLYEELKNKGYEVDTDDARLGYEVLTKMYHKTDDVLWYGKVNSKMSVSVMFNKDHTIAQVTYADEGFRVFKHKVHMADKRAYNAIADTVRNKGYEF